MEMFIPTKFVRRLTTLFSSLDTNAASMQAFADNVASSISECDDKSKTSKKATLAALSADDSRDLFNALSAVFVTAAQNNISTENIKEFFLSTGAKPQIVDVLARSYQTNRGSIRDALSSIGTGKLTLCDVSWKLDFVSKDSEVDELRELRYAVTLTLQRSNEADGATHQLTFFCSMQQLQDIIAKLKLAIATVERLASSSAAGGRTTGHVAASE